jgi:hypothetical protein
MVGSAGMGPAAIELEHTKFADESEEQTRERIAERFEQVGLRLMNRTRGSADYHNDPVAAVLQDPNKRGLAAQFLGQAFVTAYNLMRNNMHGIDRIADVVQQRKEIFGDDLVRLLDSAGLRKPEIDWTQEETWPRM